MSEISGKSGHLPLWGGDDGKGIVFPFYIYIFSEYESTCPQDSKSAKKTKSIIPIDNPLNLSRGDF